MKGHLTNCSDENGEAARFGEADWDRAPRSGKPAKSGTPYLVLVVLALMSLLFAGGKATGAEVSLSEYQVKALFLVNFAKYVDWPATAFGGAASPIVIGVSGENNFGSHLEKAIEGKTVCGRAIRILAAEKDEDFAKCHMLFVSASEKKHLGEILSKVKGL